VALAGKKLGAVQANGAHSNQHLVGGGHWARHLPVLEHFGRAGLVEHHGIHHRSHTFFKQLLN
jgi:hypothetical protein